MVGVRPVTDRADSQLLERFVTGREEEAFAALLERHGPLVLGLCRRLLEHEQDAEDAFQATFLILARKAGSIRKREALAGWLYEVAYRLALRMRAAAARQRALEKQTTAMPQADPVAEAAWRELRPILDEELHRLPTKYRSSLVLCYLEGRSNREAARELGWPEGSMSRRLARARELLRDRLSRRGVIVSVAVLSIILPAKTTAAVPAALIAPTLQNALRFAAGQATAAGAVSGAAGALAESVLQTSAKAKAVLVVFLSINLVGAGLLTATYPPRPPSLGAEQAGEPAQAEQKQVKTAGDQARVDRHGDPLPPGALARMGTTRFRTAGRVNALAFLPDGKVVAATGDEGIYFLDVATGRRLRRIPAKLGGVMPFALSADGKLLAVATTDKVIRLWDLQADKEVGKLQAGWVWSLAFSRDGKLLASGEEQGTLHLWDVVSGKESLRILAQQRYPGPLAFAPDGRTLISANHEGIRFWETASGREIRDLPSQAGGSSGLALSPDGRLLAMPDQGEVVRIIDLATDKDLHRLPGHENGAGFVAFSPDGQTLAAVSLKTVRLWDVRTGKELRSIPRSEFSIWRVAFSPDGKILAGGGQDGHIPMWDVTTGKPLNERAGHEGIVWSLAFSPDGQTLASGCQTDHSVRLWEVATGKQLRLFGGRGWAVPTVAFSPDGKAIVSNCGDDSVGVWSARSGDELRKFDIDAERFGPVQTVSFSGDGKSVAAFCQRPSKPGTESPSLTVVWDLATGKQLVNHKATRRAHISSLETAFSPDGTALAMPNDDRGLVVRNVATGRERIVLLGSPSHRLARVVFSPDGKLLATSTWEQAVEGPRSFKGMDTLHLWELATGNEVLTIPIKEQSDDIIYGLAFSPDGKVLASGRSTAIQLWDVATGKELFRYSGHGVIVGSLVFSPDGKALASGLGDSTVLVWDLTRSRLPPNIVAGEIGPGDLDRAWDALAGLDAAKAHHALWTLVAVPDKAIALLKDRLQPVLEERQKYLQQVVADLDSAQFAAREKAEGQLEQLAGEAEVMLLRALDNKPSAELRRRIEALLARPQVVRSPETLRRLRAIRVLENIGSKEAVQVLERLANGVALAVETSEAQAARKRLQLRYPGGTRIEDRE
jgi:RNA polymerase sigma factor (sigma-70 family)